MQDENLLWSIFLVALPLSFLSIGGGTSILAPLQHEIVDVHHWFTNRDYIDMIALSRVAPGPGSIIVPLFGFDLAGIPGAIIASAGIFIPSSVICYFAAMVWNRIQGTPVHKVLSRGLAPIGLGMLSAGAVAVMESSNTGVPGLCLAAVSTAVLYYFSFHPLVVLAVGGVIYMGGATYLPGIFG
jgi:chromate transporter